MAYLSYSGTGSCGGSCGSGSYNPCNSDSSYPTIDSIASSSSSYIAPSISYMVAAAEPANQYSQMSPVFFESNGNLGHSKDVYGSSAGYSSPDSYIRKYNGSGQQGMPEIFSPDMFLKSTRPVTQFIGSADDIRSYVMEAFEKTANKSFPEDVVIKILDAYEFKQMHEEFGGVWTPGIQGFSINKKGFSNSLVIIKENELDRVMITIGHELGHVINFPLAEKLDEEAKAFAFEMAWVKALYEHDIAGLGRSIDPDPRPAKNGLHDVAFAFVKKMLLSGKGCFEIIKGLMMNQIKVRGDEHVWM